MASVEPPTRRTQPPGPVLCQQLFDFRASPTSIAARGLLSDSPTAPAHSRRAALMDNGNGEHPPQPNQLALAPNVIVTPENYWKNLQHIQLAKQRLAQYEQELQTGYQRYLTEEDELKKRIEAGRQAE